MNKKNQIVLCYLKDKFNINLRTIANDLSISLGNVHTIVKELKLQGLINDNYQLTQQGNDTLRNGKPQKAIILAAGAGFRMFPLNKETNKALLEVHGTTFIERLITQLHDVGVYDILIVVGYKKEDFEYLIDKYGVRLCINEKYAYTSTAYSLYKTHSDYANCYIVPSDLYFYENPFQEFEPLSWYLMAYDGSNAMNFKEGMKKKCKSEWYHKHESNMIGLAFIHNLDCVQFNAYLDVVILDKKSKEVFWEECVFSNKESILTPKFIPFDQYIECNTCEDLIRLDSESKSLDIHVFDIIKNIFHVSNIDIKDIVCTKAGMTNNSFLFNIEGEKYIMRIPGEGTSNLIDREQEGEVYKCIQSKNVCDDVLYFDPNTGYKITRFINGSHNCDPHNFYEVEKAIKFLKNFHSMKLKVNHYFDLFEKIDYYESLWNDEPSIYKDYDKVKSNVIALKNFIDLQEKEMVLTHIDAVPDNFLLHKKSGEDCIHLIDWEYAAMQDPHVDLAMFSIYSLYEKTEIDRIIDIYFSNCCNRNTRLKIYSYIAVCGLLWSNWCEYKRILGVEFGEYSLRQYRYAKDFYAIVMKEIGEKNAEI